MLHPDNVLIGGASLEEDRRRIPVGSVPGWLYVMRFRIRKSLRFDNDVTTKGILTTLKSAVSSLLKNLSRFTILFPGIRNPYKPMCENAVINPASPQG